MGRQERGKRAVHSLLSSRHEVDVHKRPRHAQHAAHPAALADLRAQCGQAGRKKAGCTPERD